MFEVVGSVRSRALRVLWALEELGLDYALDPAAPGSEAVRRLSPAGKVPLLVVREAGAETVLTDSVAIVQYLADRAGAMTHPAGTLARGLQDAMTQFACDEVDGPLWLAAKHSFVLAEAVRVPAIKPAARAEFARAMETLEARLGAREFVAGDRFTVPDLILGHCAGWAAAAKFDLPGGRVGDYFARLRERPALARAMRAGAGA